MRKGGTRSIFCGAVVAAALLAPSASAATLVGDYQFQGTRASSGPGPDLIAQNDIGTYPTENVMGTSRKVDAFPQGAGFQMSPTGFTSATPAQSVVMTFRLLDDTGFNRILDWSHGGSDNGIYDDARTLSYFRTLQAVDSGNPVLGSNTYSTLALTSTPAPNTRAFVNGTPVLQSPHDETIIGDALTFFVDNTSGGSPGEESAGAISCLRVYSGVLTDAQIGAIGASPDCKPHPVPPPISSPQTPGSTTTTTPHKKCKKHKKKRSAQSAKKKCKKKKKR